MLVFSTEGSFNLCYTLLKGKSCISKNNDTPLWNFVPNSGFRRGISIVYYCDQQNSLTVELVEYSYDGRERRGRIHCAHTLVDCNPLTPLLRFVLDLSYSLLPSVL